MYQASFSVLEKACEDYPKKLDKDINGQRPLDFMIPKFITLADDTKPRIRSHAITSLSHFIPIQSQSLFANIDDYMACLFRRAGDESADVRRGVCSSLVLLLVARPDRLLPEMPIVAPFMLYTTQDKDENVALEACEFWLTFAEEPDLIGHLAPLVPDLAPVLLKCMVYGEEDLVWLDGLEDDADVADKETDIKPRHYSSGKGHGYENAAPTEPGAKPKLGAGAGSLEDEDEFDDYDPELDDEDGGTEWNLRKCAAAALDILAVRFQDDLLKVLLPHLNERLHSQDWLQKESAILALGAMAEGPSFRPPRLTGRSVDGVHNRLYRRY
jgi:transportin-1